MDDEDVKIFVSYSHKDDEWQEKITQELRLLGINVWVDREIKPGGKWESEIEEELAAADIILLLISRDFLTSDFVTDNELPAALTRLKDEHNAAQVVPVLLRATTWKKKFDLGELNAIPRNEQWLTKWQDEDEAIQTVARDIEVVVDAVKDARVQRQKAEEEYRLRVAEFLADDDEISIFEERSLEEERQRHGLSEKVAEEIRRSEQRRVEAKHENIRAYEEDLVLAIESVGRPFDEKTREELKKRKAILELRDTDVAGLEDEVAERLENERAAEAKKQRDDKRRAEQEAKTEKARKGKAAESYRQQVEAALSDGRITKSERAALSDEQQALEVSDKDAAEIETAEREARKARLAEKRKASAAADRKAKATAAKAQEKRVDALTGALEQFAANGLFIAPSIPPKRLRNVRNKSSIPEDETIVAVIDCTLLGSAKEHWAFTDAGLYYHASGGQAHLGYDELKPMSVAAAGDREVRVGSELTMSVAVSSITQAAAIRILEAVKKQL